MAAEEVESCECELSQVWRGVMFMFMFMFSVFVFDKWDDLIGDDNGDDNGDDKEEIEMDAVVEIEIVCGEIFLEMRLQWSESSGLPLEEWLSFVMESGLKFKGFKSS